MTIPLLYKGFRINKSYYNGFVIESYNSFYHSWTNTSCLFLSTPDVAKRVIDTYLARIGGVDNIEK